MRTVHLCALAATGASVAAAQQAAPPVRQVSAPTATTAATGALRGVDQLLEIRGGKVLVNDGDARKLVVFDASLAHATVVADTVGGTTAAYPGFAKLIPYLGDSTLFVDADSRSMVLVDPDGKLGRVMAPPRPQDFNFLMNSGPAGTDTRGHLIYQGRLPFLLQPGCAIAGADAPRRPAPPPASLAESVVIIRANFDTRTVDTVDRAKVAVTGFALPVTVTDANCKVLSASLKIDPSIQFADAWTVTSGGSVAIIRGHDYHVDFIDADGTKRSGPKLPFDWRRLTDAEKQAKVDSARKVVDSLTALGGYRMKVCGNSRTFSALPPDSSGQGGDMIILGGARGGPAPNATCQTVTVAAEFAPLAAMADYIAPVHEYSAKADLDGNVWVLPTTSLSAKGGLLYDVISPTGDLVERVQLPAGREIAGFGRRGVLFLSHNTDPASVVLERVSVIR